MARSIQRMNPKDDGKNEQLEFSGVDITQTAVNKNQQKTHLLSQHCFVSWSLIDSHAVRIWAPCKPTKHLNPCRFAVAWTKWTGSLFIYFLFFFFHSLMLLKMYPSKNNRIRLLRCLVSITHRQIFGAMIALIKYNGFVHQFLVR